VSLTTFTGAALFPLALFAVALEHRVGLARCRCLAKEHRPRPLRTLTKITSFARMFGSVSNAFPDAYRTEPSSRVRVFKAKRCS
jgi:hypothetical protein